MWGKKSLCNFSVLQRVRLSNLVFITIINVLLYLYS
jgi:hypothetical protein